MPAGRAEQNPFMDSGKYGWANLFRPILRRLEILETKKPYESVWNFPGVIAPTTPALTDPDHLSADLSHVTYVQASLTTVDVSNPVKVGFYLNDVEFTSLYIPTTSSTPNTTGMALAKMPWVGGIWAKHDTVQDSGNIYRVLVPGEAGSSAPGWTATMYALTYDHDVVWECVWVAGATPVTPNYVISRRYASPTWTSSGIATADWAAWTLQQKGSALGSGADQLKVCIDSYPGSTAAGFGAKVRFI